MNLHSNLTQKLTCKKKKRKSHEIDSTLSVKYGGLLENASDIQQFILKQLRFPYGPPRLSINQRILAEFGPIDYTALHLYIFCFIVNTFPATWEIKCWETVAQIERSVVF